MMEFLWVCSVLNSTEHCLFPPYAPKVLDAQLGHPIYSILQGIQPEVGHNLINSFY